MLIYSSYVYSTISFKPTFAWNSPYWLNDVIYNADKGFLSPLSEEAKYPAFSHLRFSEACLGMKSKKSGINYMKIPEFKSPQTLKEIFNSPFQKIENGREAWLKLLNGSKLQADCSGTSHEGFNVQGKATNVRLGITCYDEGLSPEWTDSWIGLGGENLFCLENDYTPQPQSSSGNQCCSEKCSEFSLNSMSYLFLK